MTRLGIAPQTYAGFLLLAALAVASAFVSQRMSTSAQREMKVYEETVAHSTRVMDLRAQVMELQSSVQVFTLTGHRAIAKRSRDKLRSIQQAVADLAETSATTSESSLLARFLEALDAYEKGFEFAVEERSLRDKLVFESLVKLNESADRIRESNETSSAERDILSRIRILINGYLTDPRFSLLEEAAELRKNSHDHSPEVSKLVEAYHGLFTRLVQATRGYMFLVNVVLAGHANEFSFSAERYGELTEGWVREISHGLTQTMHRSESLSRGFSIGSVLFSLWLAYFFKSRVAKPLRTMTETLRKLGEGRRNIAIPGASRKDEIGVMARAADIFRQQNEDTRKLLSQTQHLAESLDEHKRELLRSNEELEQFVHTASHDLKAPLVTGTGFLGMARELISEGEIDVALSKLDRVDRAHRRMNQLLTDLLELSRVGRTDSNRQMVAVSDVVAETFEDFQSRFPNVRFECGTLPSIWANESRVFQVFENLIGNAVKYAGPEARVRISAQEDERAVRILIEDDGPGIAEEYREQVFALFQRLSNSSEGTGVGLAVVARVMKAHGGRVWLGRPADLGGAQFWLEFPKTNTERSHAA